MKVEARFFMSQFQDSHGENFWRVQYGFDENAGVICVCSSELTAFLLITHLNATNFQDIHEGCYDRGGNNG